jgi:hypothetical protein
VLHGAEELVTDAHAGFELGRTSSKTNGPLLSSTHPTFFIVIQIIRTNSEHILQLFSFYSFDGTLSKEHQKQLENYNVCNTLSNCNQTRSHTYLRKTRGKGAFELINVPNGFGYEIWHAMDWIEALCLMDASCLYWILVFYWWQNVNFQPEMPFYMTWHQSLMGDLPALLSDYQLYETSCVCILIGIRDSGLTQVCSLWVMLCVFHA